MSKPINQYHEQLIQAINGSEKPGYVYTYPPKRAFRPLDKEKFNLSSAWNTQTDGINIYLHIPFCKVRCKFCNLFTMPTSESNRSITEQFTEAMIQEIKNHEELIGSRKVESIYFGGGTPTFLTPKQLGRIMEQLKRSFKYIPDNIEKSIEMYPDDSLEPGKLESIKEIGFNRISFGIQTFDSEELATTGRGYPAELGKEVIPLVKNLGFDDINIDLIYGLPGQDLASWKKNLHIAGELLPSTVTLYPLMIRPVTAYSKQQAVGKTEFKGFSEKFEWYEYAKQILKSYGYMQDSTVRFVLPGIGGYRQQDNEFAGTPTVGFGPGARSSSPDYHYSTDYAVAYGPTKGIIESYIESVLSGNYAATQGFELNYEEKIRRFVIQAVQLPGGFNLLEFENTFGFPLLEKFSQEFAALEEEDCITIVDNKVKLTEKGRKYSDMCAHLFYSQNVRELEKGYQHV
ncbi:radical SAM protein [Priestia megaterium]